MHLTSRMTALFIIQVLLVSSRCLMTRGYDSMPLTLRTIPTKVHSFDQHTNLAHQFRWLNDISPMPAYLASFVISDEPPGTDASRDNLVYWRTYGDGGRGCSIEFFCSTRELQKVRYGRTHIETTSRKLEPLLLRISPLTELPSPIGDGVRKLVCEALNGLRYLYKADDYEYEQECRLVVLRQQLNTADIDFDYRRDHNGATQVRPFCYDDRLNLAEILNDTGATVTIGPAAASPKALARSIQLAIEKLGLYGAAVKTSPNSLPNRLATRSYTFLRLSPVCLTVGVR